MMKELSYKSQRDQEERAGKVAQIEGTPSPDGVWCHTIWEQDEKMNYYEPRKGAET